jgi:hypothetical protein
MEDKTTLELYEKIHILETKVNVLQERLRQQATIIQSFKTGTARFPQTNLLSPNFLTRVFAVWGHYFVAQLVIGFVIFIVFFCLGSLSMY